MSRWLQAVAIVLSATSAFAQTVSHHDDGTVTIRAEGVAVATLLAEIARNNPIERVTIQPGLEQQPVSIVLERVFPAAALVAVLKASGLDFAMSGQRVIAGDWTGPAGLKAGRYTEHESNSSKADYDVRSGRPLGRPDGADRPTEGEAQHVDGAAIDLSWAGDETTIFPMPPVQFIANGENITYLEPSFVPYKMRPHVRALRMAIDVATIP